MKKARETKIPIWLELLVIALLIYLGFLTGSIKVVQKCEFLDALLYTSNNFYKFYLIRFNDTSATYGFLAGIIGWIALEWYKLSVFKNLNFSHANAYESKILNGNEIAIVNIKISIIYTKYFFISKF